MNERMVELERLRATRTRPQETEWVAVNAPVRPQRALTRRGPLALATGSGLMLMAVWVFGVLGSAGALAGSAGPLAALPGSAASVRQNTTLIVEPAPASVVENVQPARVNPPPPLLQSSSADSLPALITRPDGRAAVSSSPAVLVIYVPANYYPQPASRPPPTRESAQQTAAIVEQLATGHEEKAVEPARALQAAQPAYAAEVAQQLQLATETSPRYNVMRQVLAQLDPSLVTNPQVRTQVQPQAQAQAQTGVQAPARTALDSAAQPVSNLTEKEKAARVNALIMGTVPAFVKMPFGVNEGTFQVNTLVAPTPAYLFDQAQIRAALCEIGSGEVVAVHDTIPAAWELKATFIPKDPVRWFTILSATGGQYYLPNYLDPVREIQVGDRLVSSGVCNVQLVKK